MDPKGAPGVGATERGGFGASLPRTAALAGWPTTTKQDGASSARHGYMLKGHPGTTLLDAARLAGEGTPTANTPGTFPLAHGTPQRVGRLRAYGNAIVAPQAIEFIKAVMAFLTA